MIDDPSATTFLDLGCGKGRALIVASEFPFRRILGVELSPNLAAAAKANAAIVADRFPDRTAIEITKGDASVFPLPPGPLAIFLYHPFHLPLMKRLTANLEQALHDEARPVDVIYCNPIWASAFDESPLFARYATEIVAFDADEQGFAPGSSETVIVWKSLPVVAASP